MMQQAPPSPEGPFCQSCGMPLQEPDAFGTETDASRSDEYCGYCYQDGAFTGEMTMEEMVEISARGMSEATGTPEDEAKAMVRQILPGLKRWRTSV